MNWKEKPQPYWENREWYEKRNKRIYKDRQAGMSWSELAKKYDLSTTRMQQLINKKERNKNG